MKMMIIGAGGRLGIVLCREACDRGHEVVGVSLGGENREPRLAEFWQSELFDLKKEDVLPYDVVICAYGSSFRTDPRSNRRAAEHLISICSKTDVRVLYVGNAGSLFTDETHETRVYETEEHPEFMRAISEQMTKGLEAFEKSKHLNWCYLCPSLDFDHEGLRTGAVQIGTDVLLYGRNGKSRISYADFASVVLDEAESGAHTGEQITACVR